MLKKLTPDVMIVFTIKSNLQNIAIKEGDERETHVPYDKSKICT